MKKLMTLAALALSMALTSACALGETVLQLGTTVNEQDSFHVAATKFAELVSERTNGEYKIEIYPNGTLGDESTMLDSMTMGMLDMGIITSGPFVNFSQMMGVLDMPYLFANNEEAYKVLDSEIGRELLDTLEDAGLKGLAYAERGFRNLTNSVRPINNADDLAGLKLRVMENEVYTGDLLRAEGQCGSDGLVGSTDCHAAGHHRGRRKPDQRHLFLQAVGLWSEVRDA